MYHLLLETIPMSLVIEFYISKKIRAMAITKLQQHFDAKYPDDTCKNIEKGIYDYTNQYCKGNNCYFDMVKSIYNDKLSDIEYNLIENHSTIKKIKKAIRQKKYNAYNIAFLSPEELNEDQWMKILVRRANTEEKLNNLPAISWKPCDTCKTNEYFFYQLQTRSADEPMTTFYTCKKCRKEYRTNN